MSLQQVLCILADWTHVQGLVLGGLCIFWKNAPAKCFQVFHLLLLSTALGKSKWSRLQHSHFGSGASEEYPCSNETRHTISFCTIDSTENRGYLFLVHCVSHSVFFVVYPSHSELLAVFTGLSLDNRSRNKNTLCGWCASKSHIIIDFLVCKRFRIIPEMPSTQLPFFPP